MIVWYIFGIWFVIWESYALLTHEKRIKSLSKTIWYWTGKWNVRLPGPRPTTIKPLRILLFVVMVWLTVHLVWGPCAWGIC